MSTNRSLESAPLINTIAGFLRANQRVARPPSLMVRGRAVGHLVGRQNNLASSRPVVILDLLWNLLLVVVASAMLIVSKDERPLLPLRLWVVGYALQCVIRLVFVCSKYGKWRIAATAAGRNGGLSDLERGWNSVSFSRLRYGEVSDRQDDEASFSKRVGHIIRMFALIWWMIGFYWVSYAVSEIHNSPKLFWLSVVFLAFDLLLIAFCTAVAIVIGLALCCCLPCFIAILYVVAEKDGATEEDIRRLPKYKFRTIGDFERPDGETCPSAGIMTECGHDALLERKLALEDAECCICFRDYEDGEELRQLPCNHHFHCACVDKWLYINATCPLCKYKVIKVGNGDIEDVSQV